MKLTNYLSVALAPILRLVSPRHLVRRPLGEEGSLRPSYGFAALYGDVEL